MNIHLLKLKAELKVLAKTIKTIKFNLRNDQSQFDKKYSERHTWEQKEVQINYSNYHNACEEFRAKHIAYCMLRGKTIEQIEPKLKYPNCFLHTRVRKQAAKIVTETIRAINSEALYTNAD